MKSLRIEALCIKSSRPLKTESEGKVRFDFSITLLPSGHVSTIKTWMDKIKDSHPKHWNGWDVWKQNTSAVVIWGWKKQIKNNVDRRDLWFLIRARTLSSKSSKEQVIYPYDPVGHKFPMSKGLDGSYFTSLPLHCLDNLLTLAY
jgi:hypothetical protein